MNTLIVAEKPSVALRLAIALSEGSPKKISDARRVSYYEINAKEGTIYIAAAVGHLFTIRQVGNSRGYPVLDVDWAPSHEVSKFAGYTKNYLDVLKDLAPKCQAFINACDFDLEGTVIGTNIIKFLNNGSLEVNAKRMKFSTTTRPDLINAYANLMPLDMNNFQAGEARHMLDWIWGINLSRALMHAVSSAGFKVPLSIGRVQGPTLALLAKKEREIAIFVPKPFWRIIAVISGTEFTNVRGDIFEKEVAQSAFDATKAKEKEGLIESADGAMRNVPPYPPFDLTALQLEASRVFHIDPSRTLALAQSLYERSYISYPRTTSQKLPYTLGLPKILEQLSKNPKYESLSNSLISSKRFKPHEGLKTDDAHPAIFPTGELPRGLTAEEEKLYDLITKRFLSCFAEWATVQNTKILASFGDEKYAANGAKVLKPGWLEFYTYSTIKQNELPPLKKGDGVEASDVKMPELRTQPPRRYTKASMIAELEKLNLGTKATRAAIVDTLFKRGYIEGGNITVTSFGMSVYQALKDNAGMIVDEATTRQLEEDMEKIVKGEKSEHEVIDEGKQLLVQAIEQFDKNKDKISQSMTIGMQKSENVLGKCIRDGGNLIVRHSRMGKQFVACSNYPKCTQTYSLPQYAKIVATGKVCEHCHTPVIKVIRKSKGVFEMDLDPNCITKKDWGAKRTAAAEEKEAAKPNAAEATKSEVKAAAQKAKENAFEPKHGQKKKAKTKAEPKKQKRGAAKLKPKKHKKAKDEDASTVI
jgi:DNA topoisomerase-1